MSTAPDRPSHPLHLPWWARLADLYVIVILLFSIRLIVFGPFVHEIFGIRLIFKSLGDNLFRAFLVLAVRHVLLRRPTLPAWLRAETTRASAWLRRRWPAVADVLPSVIVTRLGVLVVGLVAVTTFGYPEGAPPYRYSPDELRNLPVRWDVGWYVGIAFDGYTWNPRPTHMENVVFFPAYPMIVRAAGLFRITEATADIGTWIAVGVSSVAFLFALIYVHRIARAFGGNETGRVSALLMATYPFALFFGVPYSESLFLLGCAGACYHASRRQPVRAGAWALLVGLTRPNGLLLAAPLGLFVIEDLWRAHRAGTRTGITRLMTEVRAVPRLVAAAMPVLGVAAYSAVNWYYVGRPFLWMEVQHIGWERTLGDSGRLGDRLYFISKFGLTRLLEINPIDTITLPAVALALVSIWPVLRRLGVAYGAFVALNVLVPLAYGLMSMGRFTSILFPTFIWLALALPPSLRAPTAAVFALGQGVLAALFFTWRQIF